MASPKTPKNAKNADGGDEKIVMLLNLITAGQLSISTSEAAPLVGVTHAKNVARKINSTISPYGFEFRAGKFYKKDSAGANGSGSGAKESEGENGSTSGPAAAAAAAAAATAAVGGEQAGQADAGAQPASPTAKKQTPAASKGKKKAAAPSTPASKKRKLDNPDNGTLAGVASRDDGQAKDEEAEHPAAA